MCDNITTNIQTFPTPIEDTGSLVPLIRVGITIILETNNVAILGEAVRHAVRDTSSRSIFSKVFANYPYVIRIIPISAISVH